MARQLFSDSQDSSQPSGRAVLLFVGIVFFLASLCLIALSWDGSYVLYHALQLGEPMLPHGRYSSWLIMWPVAWLAQDWTSHPWPLAVLQGIMYSLPVILSFGAGLAMLKGRFAPLRYWLVWGILIGPLPGQVCLTMEALPVTQVFWVLLAFLWIGAPTRWALAPLLAAAFMWFLHPASGPLFLAAAFFGALLIPGMGSEAKGRLPWILLFSLAGIAKSVITWATANSYEKSHLAPSAFFGELQSGLFGTLFPVLIPLLLPILLQQFLPSTHRLSLWSKKYQKHLWILALIIGVAFALSPVMWTGAINYRKFAFLMAIFLAIPATIAARKINIEKDGGRSNPMPTPDIRPLLAVWAIVFLMVSAHFRYRCHVLQEKLARLPAGVVDSSSLQLIPNEVLDHWSICTTAFLLEGWKPQHVVIRQEGFLKDGNLYLFPTDGNPLPLDDGPFQTSHLNLPENHRAP
jgi:hypothetical protein